MSASTLKKKVLIIRNAYSFDFGGGERFPVDLARELKTYGDRPVVISRSEKVLDYAESRGVVFKRGWWLSKQDWGGLHAFLLPIYFIWQFLLVLHYLCLIIRFRADVVHILSRDDFIAATLAANLLRKRVVWTDCADLKYIYQSRGGWYRNIIGKLVYQLSKGVHAVTLVSKNEQGHIEESLGHTVPDNYQVVYMGVPSEKVAVIKRDPKDKGAVIFGATSRLVEAKGIGELIEAFKSLDNKNTRLWLFGEGPEAKRFEEMADGNERIVFWGFPADSLSHLADADVFVHPSYHEGFSISLIEATKLGLPIIACNVGGNPELVEHKRNGLLIPARDSAALAKAMKDLIDNPDLRKKYGDSGQEIFEANFTHEKVVREGFRPLYD